MSGQNKDSEGKKVKLQDKKLSEITVNDVLKILAWSFLGVVVWIGGWLLYGYLAD